MATPNETKVEPQNYNVLLFNFFWLQNFWKLIPILRSQIIEFFPVFITYFVIGKIVQICIAMILVLYFI